MDIILHTYGTLLNRDAAGFVITTPDGLVKHLPPQGISSFQVSGGVQVGASALLLAIEYEIEVVILDRTGQPQGRVWSHRYGSISTIRRGQLAFSQSSAALDWIKGVIGEKILNQQALLLSLDTPTSREKLLVDRAVSRLEEYLLKVRRLDAQLLREVAGMLRGWEGAAAKIYFSTLSLFLPEAYRFESRSQHPALDPANALFNYAYGFLYGKVEGELIRVGIDPYIGVLHRDEYNRPVLVYDVIECYRVWADYVIMSLLTRGAIGEEFYSVRNDGACWLEALGRRMVVQSMNDYLDEVVLINGLSRSRATHLHLYVQQLATHFKTLST